LVALGHWSEMGTVILAPVARPPLTLVISAQAPHMLVL
jgi:hypothetical protein